VTNATNSKSTPDRASERLSCSTWAYSRWDLPDALESMARAGYRGVELLTQPLTRTDGTRHEHLRPNWPDEEIAEIQAHIRRLGLVVTCVSPSTDFLEPRYGSIQGEVEEVCRNVDLAVRLGASLVRPFATHDLPAGMERADAIETMAGPLRQTGVYAAGKGVRIAIENHGIWPGIARNMADLLEAIGHDAVGITLHIPRDTAEELLDLAPDKIWHLHLTDRGPERYANPEAARLRQEGLSFPQIAQRLGVSIDEASPKRLALGEGEANLAGIVNTLLEIGYDGWFNHEGGPEPNPEPTEIRSIAYLRQLLAKAP
jgi:sugar phosphate isomerase/epimerase